MRPIKGITTAANSNIGSFTVTALKEGTTAISCVKALLTDSDAEALSNVSGNSVSLTVAAASGGTVIGGGGSIGGGGGGAAAPDPAESTGVAYTQSGTIATATISDATIAAAQKSATRVSNDRSERGKRSESDDDFR